MKKTESIIKCLVCEGGANLVGKIPSTNFFAGRCLEKELDGGVLYRCNSCSLGFRWPRLSNDELNDLYEEGAEFAWPESKYLRNDWTLAKKWILQRVDKGRGILDVGCFDGGFLAGLIDCYKCYGVEIHKYARNRAESKGILLVGRDFANVNGEFECVTAFDVIEHVENPKLFLSGLLRVTKPGGLIVLSTGNLDCFTFRMMGSHYWYCLIAEHISFISPKWMQNNKSSLGYKILEIKKFSHSQNSLTLTIKELISNVIYWLNPSLLYFVRTYILGNNNGMTSVNLRRSAPSWMTAKDHFIVLIQKNEQ